MFRSFTYSALILRVRPSGESNREVWFLTAEEGILRATVFGGPKSKLRSHAAPFHQGTLWMYRDPVKNSQKVIDFDVRSWRPGLRERYERVATASAVAETILASHGGGGNWSEALTLAHRVLDALNGADEPCCVRILIYFLWNWAMLLGLRHDVNHCASCACEVPGDKVLWFSKRESALLCPSCVEVSHGPAAEAGGGAVLPIGPGSRRWLAAVEDLDPSLLARYTLDNLSLGQAKALVTGILAGSLGRRLGTWGLG
ncbi:MAG: recombination protein O N-terminal domain-containing protein [Treponema sp.]|jgi:DNA repair protein RecO (recombination protein O)|nr:recombination protein O N-terminal domain-containing protein [Treponema sp.]